jgi:hypothetical protein
LFARKAFGLCGGIHDICLKVGGRHVGYVAVFMKLVYRRCLLDGRHFCYMAVFMKLVYRRCLLGKRHLGSVAPFMKVGCAREQRFSGCIHESCLPQLSVVRNAFVLCGCIHKSCLLQLASGGLRYSGILWLCS